MRTEVHIAMRGCTEDTTLFHEVGKGGRLYKVRLEFELVVAWIIWRVRVLEYVAKLDILTQTLTPSSWT